jgi:hypothetical protein
MNRNTFPADSHNTEEVRFQMSLLHLLFPETASSPQVRELEGLLNHPVAISPGR